jgi:hypothetical protein
MTRAAPSVSTSSVEIVHRERGVMTLASQPQLYTWHKPHHVAHIHALRRRSGW